MALPDIFSASVSEHVIGRINRLQASTTPQWGKMNAAQMLAHCAVTYELVFDNKHPKPGFLMKFILKSFVKKMVTNEVPYKHNSRTSPAFLVTDERTFGKEQERLVNYIAKTQALGAAHFDGKESHSFGVMNKTEWNNMFYKHLDHHLTQFGV
ncbi:MAG: DUF1569 domain-containing protein [Sphingobacteriales bacterium]|nr:MAG: DUF1569 domain-containing protein [Sphingobacteriales bacterium]